ncbi:MAG: hypothetical protein NC120_14060 [Ruminococcus sp.]|nr:hypothetical protein [Ruminococcus sp.]
MKYTAVRAFAGIISMKKGETRELPCGAALTDLLRCGYVIPCDPSESEEVKSEAKRGKQRQRKAGNKSGL